MWDHEEEAKVAETVMRAKRAKVEKNRNTQTDTDIRLLQMTKMCLILQIHTQTWARFYAGT